MRREFIILFFLAVGHFAFGQETTTFPQHYFHAPLDTPLTISGGYGEPRGREFHWGVDFKTHATVGHNVYAAADGYVCRIKVSPFGYGKAIYIMHPNGYMTVYGHLLKYRDDIAAYVKKMQYSKQSFDIDLFFQPKQFPVHQGDIIGLSGTSGGSTGPHLHFEIRDASGETYPLNPLHFGLPVKDTIPPTLTSLAVYPLDNKGKAPDIFSITKKDNSYKLKNDTVVVFSQTVGFGISAYDKMQDSAEESHFGIYSLEEKFDDTVLYAFQIDRLDFSWGAYASSQIDYREKMLDDKEYYLCYTPPGGILPLQTHIVNDGIITLHDSKPHHVTITTKDAYGNTSSLNFIVQFGGYNDAMVTPELHFDQYFPYDKENDFMGNYSHLTFPKGCLFDNLFFRYVELDTSAKNIYSKLFYIQNPYVPLKSSFTLELKPDTIPERLKSHAIICYKDKDGKISGISCIWSGDYLTAKSNVLGEFFIAIDTTPPVIHALTVNSRNELTRSDSIEFRVTDNLSGISSYIGTIDNKWVLLDYDAKNDLLSLNLDDVENGEHEFKLEVSDGDHNQSNYSLKFKK